MYRIAVIIVFVFLSAGLRGQHNPIDSLSEVVRTAKHDTTRAQAYVQLTEHYAARNLDTVIPLCMKAIELAEAQAL